MQVDIFLLKILFLFFPGIIAYFIVELLTETKSKNSLYHVLNIFVLGVLSYSITHVIYRIFNWLLHFIHLNIQTKFLSLYIDCSNFVINTNFIQCLFNENSSIAMGNIIFVTFIAVILGLIITYIIQHGLIHKWAQKHDISRKFSDSTVWGYIFNSQDLSQWITVRDIKNDLMFQGWLSVFSAENKNNELFLTDVRVFKNSTGKFLYETYGLYITRCENDITIEFYKPEEGKNEGE